VTESLITSPLSRATAGVYRGRIILSTPGSEGAVRMAMEKLILPELGHMVREITKYLVTRGGFGVIGERFCQQMTVDLLHEFIETECAV
jgi:hypothetical protein